MLYDCRRTPAQSRPTASSPHPDDALEGDSDHQRSAPDALVSRATARSESSEIIDIGSELRQARERLRRSLTDVAAALTIRRSHLAALEEGRLETLPGLTYALGFLRLYATALGLDADELVQRFKAAAARVAPPAKLVFPTPVPARGAPTGAVALLGLVLAVGAYVAWYRRRRRAGCRPKWCRPCPRAWRHWRSRPCHHCRQRRRSLRPRKHPRPRQHRLQRRRRRHPFSKFRRPQPQQRPRPRLQPASHQATNATGECWSGPAAMPGFRSATRTGRSWSPASCARAKAGQSLPESRDCCSRPAMLGARSWWWTA